MSRHVLFTVFVCVPSISSFTLFLPRKPHLHDRGLSTTSIIHDVRTMLKSLRKRLTLMYGAQFAAVVTCDIVRSSFDYETGARTSVVVVVRGSGAA